MKYMGSKSRFSKKILPIILNSRDDVQWYVEPFAGGMNLISDVRGNRLASDSNYYLIEMWRHLLNGWVPAKITRDVYDKVRENKCDYPAWFVGWVGFNCSYSGKWFGGFAGETITKLGTIRDYQDEAIRNVIAQVGKLAGTHIICTEYYNLQIPDNSIIYCDPPYQGTTKYFSDFDHPKFWEWVREQVKNGHKVYISEYQAPDDFICIWEQTATSSLSANGKSGGNKLSTERLFLHNSQRP